MSFFYKSKFNIETGSGNSFLLETLDEFLAEIDSTENYKNADIIRDINNYIFLIIENKYDLYDKLKSYEKKLFEPYSQFLNKFFIYYLYKKNKNLIKSLVISENVKNYINDDFERILKILKDNKPFIYRYENYIHYSYIKIMFFKMFPVGIVNLDISFYCRSVFFKQSYRNKIAFLESFLISKGSRPFFQMHHNPHRLRKFNRDGWREAITLTGELLESLPQVKGVCGSAWYFDPALEIISPELCYIREQFESVGGKLFFNGRTEQDRINAFAMSKKRSDAFSAGTYDPTNYLMILPRVRLLENINNLKIIDSL